MADLKDDKSKRGGKQKGGDGSPSTPRTARRKSSADEPASRPRVVARSTPSKPATAAGSASKAAPKKTAGRPVATKATAGRASAGKAAPGKAATAKATAAKPATGKRTSDKTTPARATPKTSPARTTPAKAAGRATPAKATAAKTSSAKAAPGRAKTPPAKAAPGKAAGGRPAQAPARSAGRRATAGAPARRPRGGRAAAPPVAPDALEAAGAPVTDSAIAAGAAPTAEGTVISEWPPRVEAPTEVKGTRARAPRRPATDRQRRSRRGLVIAGLVALLVGVVLGALQLGLPLPGSANPPTPSSGGWTWVIIGAVVLSVFVVGAAIATSQKRGWRWVLDTRVVGLVAALLLVCVGLTQLFPPGAQFDVGEIPSLAGNALQGIGAQPESGYPRIRISRVSIDLLLVKGDGKTPPVKYEAFTFPNADHLLAANNDGTGNSYVYAHARNGMFWRLHDLRIGDVVEVDYGNNKVYKYRVSELHPNVNWRDLSWLQPTSDDRITLQTCNGWKDDDPRFIVVARRVADQTATASP
jgi:LPXTG-site transpeptidase (sortase) family protein